MTSPETFRTKITELWDKLDTIVPAGSHMMVTGVIDGKILYNCLKDKTEPIGITYPAFYNFLNCMDTSPCAGWMNTSEAARDGTLKRANELNDVYKELIATKKWKNFDIIYHDFPINFLEKEVIKQGGKC